jgi:hypothetical protein
MTFNKFRFILSPSMVNKCLYEIAYSKFWCDDKKYLQCLGEYFVRRSAWEICLDKMGGKY